VAGTTDINGPLGIIAGRGPLPCAIADAAAARNLPIHVIGIRGEASEDIGRFSHTWMKWGEVGKLFGALKEHGCTDLIIIGGVNRPDFENVRFDLGAIKTLPFLLSLAKGGDEYLLSRIVRFFEDQGYRVHGAGDILPELLVPEGTLTKEAPTTEDFEDITLAFDVVQTMGKLDIGQAAVVAKGHVLAVEAAEGTDAMLARCAEIKSQGRSHGARCGVLVKAPKPGQEERIDMPTIGPETVRRVAAAGLAGIAVAAGHTLLAERMVTLKLADAGKLFVFGQKWSGSTLP
jgi:DUF1009 family protein